MAAAYTLLKKNGIRLNAEKVEFSADAANRYFIAYQNWLAAGNTPDPIEADPPLGQDDVNATAAKADVDVIALAAMTPAQAAAYVQANVTDLASAKLFLKRVAVILSVLAKRI